jgi:thiol:disulfide interchange protein
MKLRLFLLALLFAIVLPGFGVDPSGEVSTDGSVRSYDPHRDPAKDLQVAIAEAHRSDRNILLEVGGKWCSWCRNLDKFFASHADLLEMRDKNFVVVYVNYSDENKNQKFLSKFPKPAGFPHLYALDADGRLIQSQNTGVLEDGKSSYVPEKVRAFLTEYGPGKK